MSEKINLCDVMERLHQTIKSRDGGDPETSYTAQLLSEGPARCAKKFGEEAVEAAIAGAMGDREALCGEAADTLYHLLVLLRAAGVTTADVAAALAARENRSGHDEKAGR